MTGKGTYLGAALVLALAVTAVPLQAQRGQGRMGRGIPGQGGPNMGRSLDLALEHREDLNLTEEQVGELQELKTIIDEEVAGLAEEMKALRENIRAGEVDRAEGFRQMQALQGELLTASAPLRGRIQEILTVEQHNILQPLVRQDRPGRGVAGAFRGRGNNPLPRGGAAPLVGRLQGRGMGIQPRGFRGGVGLRPGIQGQGRVPALGFRRAIPRGGGVVGSVPPAQDFQRGPRGGYLPPKEGGAGLP